MGKEWRVFVEIPAGVLLDREFRKAASLRAVFGLPYLPEEVPAQKIESRTDTYLCAVDSLGVKLRGRKKLEVKIRTRVRDPSKVECWSKKILDCQGPSVTQDGVFSQLHRLSGDQSLSAMCRVPLLEYLRLVGYPSDLASNTEEEDSEFFLTAQASSKSSNRVGRGLIRPVWFEVAKRRTSSFTHGYKVVLEICEMNLSVADHEGNEISGEHYPTTLFSFAVEGEKIERVEAFLQDTNPLLALEGLLDRVEAQCGCRPTLIVGGYPTMVHHVHNRILEALEGGAAVTATVATEQDGCR